MNGLSIQKWRLLLGIKSMSLFSFICWFTIGPLYPLREIRDVLRMLKRSFLLTKDMASLQEIFLFSDSSVASLLLKDSASLPMAPLVEKTRGTNVAFSTSIILWLYVLFFSFPFHACEKDPIIDVPMCCHLSTDVINAMTSFFDHYLIQ